jgi:hypothetical protein
VNGFDLMVRGHSLVMEGHQYWHSNNLLHLFSCPNFRRVGNVASLLYVSDDMEQTVIDFEQAPRKSIVKTGVHFR